MSSIVEPIAPKARLPHLPDDPILLALQTDPGSPESSLLDSTTDPLSPGQLFASLTRNFPENMYDMSDESHLVRLLKALLGDSGAGQLKKRLTQARLQQIMATTRYFDLDHFYGRIFGFRRMSGEQLGISPYYDTATGDQWEVLDALDSSYRARLEQFSASIPFCATAQGMAFIAASITGVECRVYETYVEVDGGLLGLAESQLPLPAGTPSAVRSVYAAFGDGEASVSWTAPATTGGNPITSYTVVPNPAAPGATGTVVSGTTTETTVGGLTNGTSYVFRVYATNNQGDGPLSDPSNSITPGPPVPVYHETTYGDLDQMDFGTLQVGTYSDMEGGWGAYGRTDPPIVEPPPPADPANPDPTYTWNRQEFVVRPLGLISMEQTYELVRILTRLKPAESLVTIDPNGIPIHLPISLRGVHADSVYWEVVPRVATRPEVAHAYERPSHQGRPEEQPRPPFSGYQGEAWTYNSDASTVVSYSEDADGDVISTVNFERILQPDNTYIDFKPVQALADHLAILLGRITSDGILVAHPYAGGRQAVNSE